MFLSGVLVAAAMMLQSVDDTGTAVAKPIGDVKVEPTTGSYFQIFEFYGRPPHTWEHAQRMVRGYRYKDREGRLAHIKTGAVHYFLLLNFLDLSSKRVWIGLSAQCNEKADIKWLDGSDLSEQSFRAWTAGAAKNISRTCRAKKLSGDIMPVFYEAHELGLRWDISGEKSNLKYMLVEFPVEVESEAADAPATDGEQPNEPVENTGS